MKENVTAEVFPTLQQHLAFAQDVCRLCRHCAAQAALVSAGCAPEVQPSGEGLASTAALPRGRIRRPRPARRAR